MRARILLALAAMTGAMLLASSPAGAQDYPPEEPLLSVSSTTVVAGETVQITGTGFEPNETILITVSIAPFAAPQVGVDDLTGDQVAMVPVAQNLAAPAAPELAGGWEFTVQADDDGEFTASVTLRKPGIATITATGLESGLSASVTVTVLAAKDGLPETGSDVWRLIRIGGAGIVLGGMLLIGALVWRARRVRVSA